MQESNFRHMLELYNDCDDCDEEPDGIYNGMKDLIRHEDWCRSMEIRPIPENKRPGTRAKYLSDRVEEVVAAEQLLMTEAGRPFSYCNELGCYRPVQKLSAYLREFFPPQTAATIPVREYRDICEMLTWQSKLRCRTDEFNPCTDYVNLSNGVFNLVTSKLEQHDKSFRFNYQVDAEYLENWNPHCEEDPACGTFDKFCQSSLEGDPAKRKLLLEFIGYICTDKTEGKCALFLKGLPNSGKSVISAFIARLFEPDLVSNVPLHQLGERFFRAELVGKKLNSVGEMAGKPLYDISIFKSITGGDRIEGEFKHNNPFYFTPKCKLLFAGNTLPLTADVDATAAFVNRVRVLLFNSSVEQDKQDRYLLEKLWAERNYIVTLALRAVKQLMERNYEFTQPDDSREFLDSFALRGNVLGAFLSECCVLTPTARVFNTELYAAFEKFCLRNGLEPMTRSRFYALLSGIPHVFAKRIRIGTENRHGHSGITLKDPFRSGTLEQKL